MPVASKRQRVAAHGVARRDDEVLLARASSDTGAPGTWWLPGGGLEFGESPEQCLVREFMEETGLEVRVRDVLDVVSDVAELARSRCGFTRSDSSTRSRSCLGRSGPRPVVQQMPCDGSARATLRHCLSSGGSRKWRGDT
jgi:8-oxo-dGTP pyrophosphatase MutT (NUDIX family)